MPDSWTPRRADEIRKLPKADHKPDPPPPRVRSPLGDLLVELKPAGGSRKRDEYFVFNADNEVLALRYSWDEILALVGLWPLEQPVEERPATTPSKKGPAIPIAEYFEEDKITCGRPGCAIVDDGRSFSCSLCGLSGVRQQTPAAVTGSQRRPGSPAGSCSDCEAYSKASDPAARIQCTACWRLENADSLTATPSPRTERGQIEMW